jgi:hypothetical protein
VTVSDLISAFYHGVALLVYAILRIVLLKALAGGGIGRYRIPDRYLPPAAPCIRNSELRTMGITDA